MSSLPPGFVVDNAPAGGLPDGFVVDGAPQAQNDRRGGFLGFLNQGIASTLGAPVDLVNAGLNAVGMGSEEPFLGSRSISRGMGAVGVDVAEPGQQPQGFGEYVGRGLGGAAGALLPGAGVVGAMSRSASPVASGAAQTVARPFMAAPGRALTAEAMAGAGAGVGESVANQLAPDSQLAQIGGALAGGVVGGMGPAIASRVVQNTPVAGTALRMAQREIAPFTEAGAMERARSRVGGLVENRETALRNLDADNPGNLSPAVQTGDRRLMALEQAVRSQEPSADLAMREAETAAGEILRESFRAPARGANAEATRQFASERVGRLVNRMETRVQRAQESARQRVARTQPGQDAASASMVVREELEIALSAARNQERAIWGSVPKEELVPTNTGKARYREVVDGLSRAQRDDIPAKAREFLEDGGNQTFGTQETVREVHGLYSALRDAARAARSGQNPNRNTARIADLLADALLDDMNTVSGASAPLREALDFSRSLNQTFRQGNVGRVLGSERTGGDAVADIMTLDRTIGRQGRAGAVAMDEINRAVPNGRSQPAMQDYIASRFQDSAVRDGEIRPTQAENFLTGNRDVLERMPGTRQNIEEALQSSEAASRMRDTMANRASAVQGQSAASTLTGSRPGEEIRSILRSRNPRETAAQLARQARRDPSGAAVDGLKGALLDDLMSSARRADFDEAGNAMISGRALQARLQDDQFNGITREILSGEEYARTRRIAEEFAKIETMQGRLPSVGPIMGDEPNSIISYLARVLAARSGAQMGQGTSGASLQTAQMASRRMQRLLESLTNDRAEALIKRAVTGDRDLFRLLLTPGNRITPQQESRLIETLTGIAGSQTGIEEERQPLMIDVRPN